MLAEGVEATVSPAVRETVGAVGNLIIDGREYVSLAELMAELMLDRSVVSRRVALARDRGYLRNLESKRGKSARLVLGDPLPENVEILPSPAALVKVLQRCSVVLEGTDPRPPDPSPKACRVKL